MVAVMLASVARLVLFMVWFAVVEKLWKNLWKTFFPQAVGSCEGPQFWVRRERGESQAVRLT
jgi:hypothetical protein